MTESMELNPMRTIRMGRRPALGAALLILLAAPACGPSMNPKADRARAALETALNAWRDGKKPGKLEGTDPPVQVMDIDWTNGRKLASYEILREEPSDSDKRFVVKLSYTAPAAEAETNYIILGANPITVFRQEDYARTVNMDNNPTPKKSGR